MFSTIARLASFYLPQVYANTLVFQEALSGKADLNASRIRNGLDGAAYNGRVLDYNGRIIVPIFEFAPAYFSQEDDSSMFPESYSFDYYAYASHPNASSSHMVFEKHWLGGKYSSFIDFPTDAISLGSQFILAFKEHKNLSLVRVDMNTLSVEKQIKHSMSVEAEGCRDISMQLFYEQGSDQAVVLSKQYCQNVISNPDFYHPESIINFFAFDIHSLEKRCEFQTDVGYSSFPSMISMPDNSHHFILYFSEYPAVLHMRVYNNHCKHLYHHERLYPFTDVVDLFSAKKQENGIAIAAKAQGGALYSNQPRLDVFKINFENQIIEAPQTLYLGHCPSDDPYFVQLDSVQNTSAASALSVGDMILSWGSFVRCISPSLCNSLIYFIALDNTLSPISRGYFVGDTQDASIAVAQPTLLASHQFGICTFFSRNASSGSKSCRLLDPTDMNVTLFNAVRALASLSSSVSPSNPGPVSSSVSPAIPETISLSVSPVLSPDTPQVSESLTPTPADALSVSATPTPMDALSISATPTPQGISDQEDLGGAIVTLVAAGLAILAGVFCIQAVRIRRNIHASERNDYTLILDNHSPRH